MTNSKKSFLPKFEVLIILVFFFSFIIWAASKCNQTKESFEDETEEPTTQEEALLSDSTTTELSNPVLNPVTTTATTTPAQPAAATPATPSGNLSPLWVTIDGLNMRVEPYLNSEVILKLKLFEQVNYMGEFTDSTTVVNLGYEIADEPWFKVQHARGKVGWVYGAGVNFYKKKRTGVLE